MGVASYEHGGGLSGSDPVGLKRERESRLLPIITIYGHRMEVSDVDGVGLPAELDHERNEIILPELGLRVTVLITVYGGVGRGGAVMGLGLPSGSCASPSC